jgi:hypothetical protein
VKTVRRYDSPESRCDITDDKNPPPPPQQPPPDPPPPPPAWHPTISGPTVAQNGTWQFTIGLGSGFPLGLSTATFLTVTMYQILPGTGGAGRTVAGLTILAPPSPAISSTWTEGQSFDIYLQPFPKTLEGSPVTTMEITVDFGFGGGPDAIGRGTAVFMHP